MSIFVAHLNIINVKSNGSNWYKKAHQAIYFFLASLPSVSFGWPTIAVDTHIFRVSNRTKLAMGKDVVAVE